MSDCNKPSVFNIRIECNGISCKLSVTFVTEMPFLAYHSRVNILFYSCVSKIKNGRSHLPTLFITITKILTTATNAYSRFRRCLNPGRSPLRALNKNIAGRNLKLTLPGSFAVRGHVISPGLIRTFDPSFLPGRPSVHLRNIHKIHLRCTRKECPECA